MIKIITLLFCSLALAPLATEAATKHSTSNRFGLGVVIGDPTGITGKVWIASDAAIDMGVSYSFNEYILFYGDYLLHFPGLFGKPSRFVEELWPYLGVGGSVVISAADKIRVNDRYLGDGRNSLGLVARFPVGAEWIPTKVPIGVFFEIAPGLALIPRTTFGIQVGLGVRYYFN